MKIPKTGLCWMAAVTVAWVGVAAGVEPSRAEIFSEYRHAAPGGELAVGVRIVLDEGWHTYWTNPGDSGMAPLLAWSGDVPIRAGETMHPAPRRFDEGGLVTFGHQGEALLVTTIRLPDSLPGTSVTVRCEAQWLVCHDVCIPQSATLELTLPVVRDGGRDNESADARFGAFRATLPRPREDFSVAAFSEGARIVLSVATKTRESWTRAVFFPHRAGQVAYDVLDDWRPTEDGGRLFLRRAGSEQGEGDSKRLTGLLELGFHEKSAAVWVPVNVELAPAPDEIRAVIEKYFGALR